MNEVAKVVHLSKSYPGESAKVNGIHQLSFSIYQGECVGLVGESGCGKSTLVRQLLALEVPDEGEVYWLSQRLADLSRPRLRQLRQHVQVVFQDATAAMNDRLPIWRSVMEPLDNFPHARSTIFKRQDMDRREKAGFLLGLVGLSDEHLDRYPHELSGGQRQRVCIARAVSLCPQVLICDEPTSGLDMTIQRQILELLLRLQRELKMSMLFISHDLAVVAQLCQRVMVMKDGMIVDQFAMDQMNGEERHEYTKLLIAAAQ